VMKKNLRKIRVKNYRMNSCCLGGKCLNCLGGSSCCYCLSCSGGNSCCCCCLSCWGVSSCYCCRNYLVLNSCSDFRNCLDVSMNYLSRSSKVSNNCCSKSYQSLKASGNLNYLVSGSYCCSDCCTRCSTAACCSSVKCRSEQVAELKYC